MTVESRAASAWVGRTLGRIGWWVLVVLTALFALNHVAGSFFFASSTDEVMMFELFAALQVLALFVLFIPYRRKEPWAWVATWVSIIPLGLVMVMGADAIGVLYLAVAVIMALAQLLTLPDFRERG